MASYNVVLGMPWLAKHNLVIDWRQGVLIFEQCDCVIGIEPAQEQSFEADEIREFNRIQP